MPSSRLELHVFFDGQFYNADLKRLQGGSISYAKKIFSSEPSNAQLYLFVLHEIEELAFTEPKVIAMNAVDKATTNYKRMQRQVKKQLKSGQFKRERHADEISRKQLELEAKQKQQTCSKAEKEQAQKQRFAEKQAKKKQKKKGH